MQADKEKRVDCKQADIYLRNLNISCIFALLIFKK
jgi:hypothetical protein